jgi:hypothetical protein
MSRLVKRAAIISRLFLAAFLISLSRLLFLFEILAIWNLSFEDAWQRVRPKLGAK